MNVLQFRKYVELRRNERSLIVRSSPFLDRKLKTIEEQIIVIERNAPLIALLEGDKRFFFDGGGSNYFYSYFSVKHGEAVSDICGIFKSRIEYALKFLGQPATIRWEKAKFDELSGDFKVRSEDFPYAGESYHVDLHLWMPDKNGDPDDENCVIRKVEIPLDNPVTHKTKYVYDCGDKTI